MIFDLTVYAHWEFGTTLHEISITNLMMTDAVTNVVWSGDPYQLLLDTMAIHCYNLTYLCLTEGTKNTRFNTTTWKDTYVYPAPGRRANEFYPNGQTAPDIVQNVVTDKGNQSVLGTLNPRIQTYFGYQSTNHKRRVLKMFNERNKAITAIEKITDEYLCIDSVLDKKGVTNYRLRSIGVAYASYPHPYNEFTGIVSQLPSYARKGRILAKTKDKTLLPKWEQIVTAHNIQSFETCGSDPAIIKTETEDDSNGMEQTKSNATETPPVVTSS
jgi:hypothetical protein